MAACIRVRFSAEAVFVARAIFVQLCPLLLVAVRRLSVLLEQLAGGLRAEVGEAVVAVLVVDDELEVAPGLWGVVGRWLHAPQGGVHFGHVCPGVAYGAELGQSDEC